MLYASEAYYLTFRETYRLRVFENRILRRIFWPKSDKSGESRRLQNEELHSSYSLPNIVKVIKSRIYSVVGMEEVRSAFKILTGTPTWKRSLGRHRRRWEDNIIMDLK